MESFEQTLNQIIEHDIRPSLMAHEGNIEVVAFENQVLKVRLLGKCSDCPSARITTEELIAEKIKAKLPQVKDVVLVQETSPELLDFARKLLNHEIPRD